MHAISRRTAETHELTLSDKARGHEGSRVVNGTAAEMVQVAKQLRLAAGDIRQLETKSCEIDTARPDRRQAGRPLRSRRSSQGVSVRLSRPGAHMDKRPRRAFCPFAWKRVSAQPPVTGGKKATSSPLFTATPKPAIC